MLLLLLLFSKCFGLHSLTRFSLLVGLLLLFVQRAPPDVRNVVPNPDDEMSTAAVVYLCLTYTLRNYRKDTYLVKQAFTDCVKSTVEAALILRSEFSH